jgi:hypothetical protein
MMSWVLQYLLGFQRLGHEVYLVEKSAYPNSCYDFPKDVMTDDCSYGIEVAADLLTRFGLEDRWCYVDAGGRYHGLPQDRVEAMFKSADLFVDMASHDAWQAEAADCRLRIQVDGDPGLFQMGMENRLRLGQRLPAYDYYYTVGRNVGTEASTAPTAGKQWRPLFHPVVVDLFPIVPTKENAPFTTIMNWKSYDIIQHNGKIYGHKNIEFEKFINLPAATPASLEVALSGKTVPLEQLRSAGWRVRDAHAVTVSFDSFAGYIRSSKGEFSVCKNGYVATHSGWFGDRSAVYLASGRPVVMQDTGFSAHLPCGRGLFAVRTVDEAAAAIDSIRGDHERHSKWAREIALEYLDTDKVLGGLLGGLGI